MFSEAVLDAVVESLVKRVIEFCSDAQRKTKEYIVDATGSRRALEASISSTANWASTLTNPCGKTPNLLLRSFVDIDADLEEAGRGSKTKVSNLVSSPIGAVVLGGPGAGKTTTLKKLAMSAINEQRLPAIHIQLRDISESDSVILILLEKIGLEVEALGNEVSSKLRSVKLILAIEVMNRLELTVIIDGLDEVSSNIRRRVEREIERLIEGAKQMRVFVSCREGDYIYKFPSVRVMTLCSLSKDAILLFSQRYLGPAKGPVFYSQVLNSPYFDTGIRPLSLVHLITLFDRYGSVPDQPKSVYREVIRLLLRDWDAQRSVRRSSCYANFTVDRKEEFLESLAYQISFGHNAVSFDRQLLREVYGSLHRDFGLPANECDDVVREIQSHTGLIVNSGFQRVSFAHKSLQEYLTASFMMKLPYLHGLALAKLPNECAVTVSISSRPNIMFRTLVRDIANPEPLMKLRVHEYIEGTSASFIPAFLSRLVQERPMFSESEDLGLALISLLGVWTAWLNNRVSRVGIEGVPGSIRDFASVPTVAASILLSLKSIRLPKTSVLDVRFTHAGIRPETWSEQSFVVSRLVVEQLVEAIAPFIPGYADWVLSGCSRQDFAYLPRELFSSDGEFG